VNASASASTSAVDILIPTRDRAASLAITLTALHAQSLRDFRVIVSDQSEQASAFDAPEVKALLRIIAAGGRPVETHRHLPRRGLSEQRAFLLSRSTAPYCLFLDDDVVTEPDLIDRMLQVIRREQCGFIGSALHGLSFIDDVRPHQQAIKFWDTRVVPETVGLRSPEWERHHLHSAANLFHLQNRLGLGRGQCRLYRVAWVGGCVLFDTEKLRAAGGFDFWCDLPVEHCGEDVLVQLRVMQRFGGCGMIPSGAYHLELPTTVGVRDINAPFVFWSRPDEEQSASAGVG
jgi:glycosyltransferase involved in cell wall biosynthesis